MTVETKRWYKPAEIAKLGLITSPVNPDSSKSNYWFILKLIHAGQLKAKDYGLGGRPYWLVSADEIERYHNAEEGQGGAEQNQTSK